MKFYISILLFLINIFSLYAYEKEKCYRIDDIQNFIEHHPKKTLKNELLLVELTINRVNIDVYIPKLDQKNCFKNLLVVPGWKFSKTRWFNETRLKEFIKKYQYIAIAPEMNITVYESQYFRETKFKWHEKPGMQFIEKDLIPYLNQFHFLKNDFYNMGLGLSTGARGIVLISSRNPRLFYAIAALSGDYDQTLTPNDNLMRLTYGEYHQFKERWHTFDNPIYNFKQSGINTHFYLGHGKKDNVVSYEHSLHLYNFLKSLNSSKTITLNLCEDCKHDFLYWDKELDSVFTFYETTIN